MRGLAVAMVLALFLVAGTATNTEAQDCGNLATCSAHKMPWPAFTLWDFPHNDCRLCDGGGGDDYTLCHFPCPESDDDEATRAAYAAVLSAAREGDVRGVLRLALAAGAGRVVFNAQRQAVQIYACQGGVVASLPTRDFSLSVAAAGLLPSTPSVSITVSLPSAAELVAKWSADRQ